MDRREFGKYMMGAVGAVTFPSARSWRFGPRVAPVTVNGARINAQLTALAEFGKNPQGGVSRVAYSDFDKQGREYVLGLFREAKLDVRIDAAGNIFGRRAGSDPALKPILFGSHIDSVPEGGNYDGTVGSLSSIEVARSLGEQRVTTRHPLEVVIWQNEEGGTVGSRAFSGKLEEKDLRLVAKSGKTLREGIAFLGGDPTRIASARRPKGDISAYVELHIEQGGTLEKEKLDIGVVEGIVGIHWWDVTIDGFSNHAGTTAMSDRHDALLSAAKFVELVNRIVTSVPGRQVGTVGRIQALPGAPNVIPGKVVASLELRDLDEAKINALFDRIRTATNEIAQAHGTTFTFAPFYASNPTLTDPRVRDVIARAATSLGFKTKVLPSGAGHDAQEAARLAPMGMIFIPSIGGISHSPKEYSRPEDIVNGANVLMQTVLALDSSPITATGWGGGGAWPAMGLSFAQATPADAAALVDLRAAVAHDLTARYGCGHWSGEPSERGVLYAMRISQIWIARRGRAVVATFKLGTRKPWAIDRSYFATCAQALYLGDMAVRPELQRTGVGRCCLEEAARIARDWPAGAIRLDAYDAPAGAGGFYERCGFRDVGRVVYRGVPLVYYELVL